MTYKDRLCVVNFLELSLYVTSVSRWDLSYLPGLVEGPAGFGGSAARWHAQIKAWNSSCFLAGRGEFSSLQGQIEKCCRDGDRLPSQSVWGGKFIQKRVRTRFPLLKTTALKGKSTFGDPFEDSGVVPPGAGGGGSGFRRKCCTMARSNRGLECEPFLGWQRQIRLSARAHWKIIQAQISYANTHNSSTGFQPKLLHLDFNITNIDRSVQ